MSKKRNYSAFKEFVEECLEPSAKRQKLEKELSSSDDDCPPRKINFIDETPTDDEDDDILMNNQKNKNRNRKKIRAKRRSNRLKGIKVEEPIPDIGDIIKEIRERKKIISLVDESSDDEDSDISLSYSADSSSSDEETVSDSEEDLLPDPPIDNDKHLTSKQIAINDKTMRERKRQSAIFYSELVQSLNVPGSLVKFIDSFNEDVLMVCGTEDKDDPQSRWALIDGGWTDQHINRAQIGYAAYSNSKGTALIYGLRGEIKAIRSEKLRCNECGDILCGDIEVIYKFSGLYSTFYDGRGIYDGDSKKKCYIPWVQHTNPRNCHICPYDEEIVCSNCRELHQCTNNSCTLWHCCVGDDIATEYGDQITCDGMRALMNGDCFVTYPEIDIIN